MSDLTMMAFRVPTSLKTEFDKMVEYRHLSKTSRLITLMEDDIFTWKERLTKIKNRHSDEEDEPVAILTSDETWGERWR